MDAGLRIVYDVDAGNGAKFEPLVRTAYVRTVIVSIFPITLVPISESETRPAHDVDHTCSMVRRSFETFQCCH